MRISKKFTNITVKELSLLAQLKCKPENVAAFVDSSDPETLNINKDGKFAKDQRFWEACSHIVITHDYIHVVLVTLGVDSGSLDRVFPTVVESRFLVDGKWKWLPVTLVNGRWRLVRK